MSRVVGNLLFFFLLAFFLFAPSSIAYSEIALVLAVLLWTARGRCKEVFLPHPLIVPILVWVVATLAVALLAIDPAGSARKLPKLLPLGLVVVLPSMIRTPRRLRCAVGALLVGGAATSVYGLAGVMQEPGVRLGGFVGFYMTTAGLLMQISLLAFCITVGRGVGGTLRWIAVASLPVLLAALLFTDTRGAWIGFLAGLLFASAFLVKRLMVVPLLLLLLLIIFPGPVRETALSAIDPGHPRNRERVFMWKAGAAIFRDHPITGIGLSGMRDVYLRYRDPSSQEKAPHLHSVPIQILASMGLLGLAAWVYLFGSIPVWLMRSIPLVRGRPSVCRSVLMAGLAVWAGFVVNGLFEWNMGDVEVSTLFWSMMGLAATAAGAPERSAAGSSPPLQES